MADNLEPREPTPRPESAIAYITATVVSAVLAVGLIADLVENGRTDPLQTLLWIVAVVCGGVAVVSGFMAARLCSGSSWVGVSEKVTPTDSPGPHFRLVLLNDNTHSYQYVIDLLASVFGMSIEKAFVLTRAVDQTGRAVVFIGDAVEVEERINRVLAAGPDPLLKISTGPLQVLVEEVEAA